MPAPFDDFGVYLFRYQMMVGQVYPASAADLACRCSCTRPRGGRSGGTGDVGVDDGSEEIGETGWVCKEAVGLERIWNGYGDRGEDQFQRDWRERVRIFTSETCIALGSRVREGLEVRWQGTEDFGGNILEFYF